MWNPVQTGIYYVDDWDKGVIASSLRELQKRYDKPVLRDDAATKLLYRRRIPPETLDKNRTGTAIVKKI